MNIESEKKPDIIAVCGPTAAGKTTFAIEIAERMENLTGRTAEIVSCDSMQLYKYMDIGSAKPTPEECARVRHHLVDEVDPAQTFSVVQYRDMAKEAIADIQSRGGIPIICGGTGLYLNSLLYEMDFSIAPGDGRKRDELYKFAEKEGKEALYKRLKAVDPVTAEKIHMNNVRKVVRAIEAAESGRPLGDISKDPVPAKDHGYLLIGVTHDRQKLYDRINRRVDLLVEQGLIDEVRGLLKMGLTEDDISMKGIGYKEIIGMLRGCYSQEEAVSLVKKNTRRFAKRQLTWFRRYKQMNWFNISEYNEPKDCISDIMEVVEGGTAYVRKERNSHTE